MHKPSTIQGGVRGSVGSAAQVVPTTKYSIGTAFENKTGDTYAAITVKCNTVYSLYVLGDLVSWASTADAGAGTTYGRLLAAETGQLANGAATTGAKGKTFFVPIATMKYVLPVVYQATGGNAAVTITYQTFND